LPATTRHDEHRRRTAGRRRRSQRRPPRREARRSTSSRRPSTTRHDDEHSSLLPQRSPLNRGRWRGNLRGRCRLGGVAAERHIVGGRAYFAVLCSRRIRLELTSASRAAYRAHSPNIGRTEPNLHVHDVFASLESFCCGPKPASATSLSASEPPSSVSPSSGGCGFPLCASTSVISPSPGTPPSRGSDSGSCMPLSVSTVDAASTDTPPSDPKPESIAPPPASFTTPASSISAPNRGKSSIQYS